jgi:endonuclease III
MRLPTSPLPTPPRKPKKRTKTNPNQTTTKLYQQIATAKARLAPVFGTGGFAMFPWQTSVLGTLVGLICAQNTTNSFSAVMYNNLITLEPNSTGLEPNWDKLRQRDPLTLQNALSCGPFYRLKSKMINIKT